MFLTRFLPHRISIPSVVSTGFSRLQRRTRDAADEVRLRVFMIDDPDGNILLVAASGSVDAGTVDGLVDQFEALDAGQHVHLDLHRATIDSVATLRRLENRLDRLETRGVRLRIVGVDPDHPVLAASGF
ncbi:MAG: hypothetical protein QNJ12_06595 [Ilumatobacter sp.]|uniref:STAS domain-containing protein n=1 Tax=Ilumatobacter sp. TaxID=1967498 RepID=UPI0026233714|nr:STAS domain-containing protein [Ilumatobacter sp.]MDJ0768443.1 hypothetical protein [Ilumatobacter sp.]